MISTVKQMLDRIQAKGAAIYARDLTLTPTFIGIRPDGSELLISAGDAGVPWNFGARPDDPVGDDGTVVPTPEAKNVLHDHVRARFAAADVQRYGVAMEVWMIQSTSAERPDYGRKGISQEPGRFEVLWFSAEDRVTRLCGRQSIIRPRGSSPYLDDDFAVLDGYDSVEGRFTGLLRLPRSRRLPGLPMPPPHSVREAVDRLDPTTRNLLLAIARIKFE